MESPSGRTEGSAGRIKAHNLHLLVDDNNGNAMDENAHRPQSAASHSSEDSRQMDQSPTGNNQSDDSLEAEMKYQEELKERLRASFADLGMDPEGVLRDSLEEDDLLRDSLDDPIPRLQKERTFVKDTDEQGDNYPLLQDSLDATQDRNNNDDDDDISVQDSLDGKQDKIMPSADKTPNHSNDNHMVAYPAVDPTLKSSRQSSGGSHNASKPSSRRNSRDSRQNSPKTDSIDQSNPPKPVAIPGINTHSRDSTPADGKVRERTRPKLLKTHSKVHRLDNGEAVRVEYISDDSGDEDMHFVDEKGSPVNNYGIPLNDKNVDSEMPRQYRIIKKPMPPKDPSPREQQILNSRRTSSGKAKRENEVVGLLESSKPQHNQTVQEPILIQKTEAQPLGIKDSTIPPQHKVDSPSYRSPLERLDSSNKRLDSPNQTGVFGAVRVASNTSGGGSYSAQNSASKKRSSADTNGGGSYSCHNSASKKRSGTGPDPYNDLRFDIDAVKKAAAEQEAALRMQSNPRDRQITHSPTSDNRNNSGNKESEESSQEPSFDNLGHSEQNARQNPASVEQLHQQQQQQNMDNFSVPQQDRRPDEIDRYHTPQRGDTQLQDSHQYSDAGQQSWQGAANQPLPHGMNQPIRTRGQLGGQYLQGPPPREPDHYFDYQQQQPPQHFNQQPMDGAYPQTFQFNTDLYQQAIIRIPVNHQHPVQSGFEPSVSNSFQQPDIGQSMQQPQQWQYQQQAGYSSAQPQHQQFQPSQPNNMYAGQFLQGSGHFNEGFNPNLQQQPQFTEQYQGQQLTSTPNGTQHGFMEYNQAPGNVPNPMNQQYSSAGPQMPFSQPVPRRQIQSGPVLSRPPRQQPKRVGPDFIARNRQFLTYGPPKKTYGQVYARKKDTETQTPPLNPNAPLPSISRENSHDAGEEVKTWAEIDDEAWTRQLIEEQKQMALLMRGQSETNIYTGVQQEAPNNLRNSYGTQASWSADHATAYARMQASQQQQQIVSPRTRVMFDDDMYNSFESEDLRSPRGQSNSHPNSKRTSPYPTLPGIPSHKKERESPLRTSDPDGYLVKLQKAKQGPQYKEYTIKDYRNLKKDMRLGGLGPDAEVVSERQEKVNRQRDYAKAVMQQNKKVLHQTKQKPWHKKAPTPTNKTPETPSRRNIAIEYAKKVPKPRVPTPPEQVHERLYGSNSRQQEDHQEDVALEMARLEELQARHMKEKQEVDKLRTEIPT
ncbi:LOW QUALITY PROTEIN: uncharacterized protein [Amphiura filiformis]|uniref:LOW QUALITY PROTEIN: uncharacterized protein n=1 Tax=Amphiura filiformis TaxID=82378 RepID=UPI003B226797